MDSARKMKIVQITRRESRASACRRPTRQRPFEHDGLECRAELVNGSRMTSWSKSSNDYLIMIRVDDTTGCFFLCHETGTFWL